MKFKKPHYVAFGPPIPVVPIGDFSKMRMTEEQFADAWRLCGPTAERNMLRLQLWQVIASAYLEGLQHGAEVVIEQQGKEIDYDALLERGWTVDPVC